MKKLIQTVRGGISILLILLVLVFCINQGAVSAALIPTYHVGDGDNIYQLEQVLDAFCNSSPAYRHSVLEYEINSYNSDLATESYNSVSSQYSQTVEKRAKLIALKQSYQEYLETEEDAEVIAEINAQITAIDDQIKQYDSSIDTLKVSKKEAKLQKDIEQFYKENVTLLKQEAEKKQTSALLKNIYGMMLLQEKQNYYEAYDRYLNTEVTVAQIKYDKGLIDKTELDVSTINLNKNTNDRKENENSYRSVFDYVKNETGIKDISKIVLSVLVTYQEYDIEKLISSYESSNSALTQLLYLKKCYQEYLNSNNEINTVSKQIDLKVKDYQFQYDELKLNIRSYVTNAVTAYQKALREYKLYSEEVSAAENSYKVITVKKEHGIATELEVKKAECEWKAAQVNYYNSLYEIMVWQYLLNNHVYGETP